MIRHKYMIFNNYGNPVPFLAKDWCDYVDSVLYIEQQDYVLTSLENDTGFKNPKLWQCKSLKRAKEFMFMVERDYNKEIHGMLSIKRLCYTVELDNIVDMD